MSEKKLDHSCPNPECDINSTGFCALHSVEVERRQDTSHLVEKLLQKVSAMSNRLNWTIGVISVSGILILGSYSFTLISKQDAASDRIAIEQRSQVADDKLSARLLTLTGVTQQLAASFSGQREQLNAQLREFSRLNDSLEKILGEQRDHERRVEDRLEKYDPWGNPENYNEKIKKDDGIEE